MFLDFIVEAIVFGWRILRTGSPEEETPRPRIDMNEGYFYMPYIPLTRAPVVLDNFPTQASRWVVYATPNRKFETDRDVLRHGL